MKEILGHYHQLLIKSKESLNSLYIGLGNYNYTAVRNAYYQVLKDVELHTAPILEKTQNFGNTYNKKDGQ